jgi:alkylation response protein AidB-like acyl-CoA dehydrogenase
MVSTLDIAAIDIARSLAEQFAPRAKDADAAGKLPAADMQAVRESGYLGVNIPSDLGGLGHSMQDTIAAHLELVQGSTSSAFVVAMHTQVIGNMVDNRTFDDDVIERLTGYALDGGLFNSIASEPKMGSPSRGGRFESEAVLHADGWHIHGHKTWITGGRHLTHMLVKLMVEDDPAVILVEGDTPGLHWDEVWGTGLSLRATDSHDLYFKDVVVPEDHLLQRGKSETGPNVWFPMMMGSSYLGAAIAARNAVIQFALERVPTALGKSIATLPKIQRQIGELDMELQAARALMLAVAGEWPGHGGDPAAFQPRTTLAKHFAVEVANRVTDRALRIAGGQSLSNSLPLERHFRDVRAGLMQPPSGDTAYEIIGRTAIGEIPGE